VIVEPHVHSQIGLAAFDAQRVPRLRLGQELAHGALRQVEHCFAEQLLTDVVVQEGFFHSVGDVFCVEVAYGGERGYVVWNYVYLRLIGGFHFGIV